MRSRAAWVGLSFLLAGAPAAARAQTITRFDPFVQKPATSPLGLFTLEGAAAGDSPEWVAVRADYGHGLLAIVDSKGKLLGQVIPDRLDMHLLAAIGFRKFLELGIDVPYTAYQADGFSVVRSIYSAAHVPASTIAALYPKLASHGLGDIRLVPKVALPFHRPFTLALIPELRLRTGDSSNFLGDQEGPIDGHAGPIFCPRAEAEGTLWRLRVIGELGYQFRGQDQFHNLVVGDQVTFGAGASIALPPVPRLTSWEAIAEFNGTTQSKAPFTFSQGETYETPLELVVGVRARVVHGVVAFGGIGTGLSGGGYGRELFRAFLALGWEPPNALSTVAVSPEEEDRDHDGVPDAIDRCPDQPGLPENDGCPDRDHDGVPDIDDKCPDEPGPPENFGCPVIGPMVVYAPPKLVLKAGINFETGKADIKSESFPVCDEVAGFLAAHKEIKKITVDGHTDNQGPAKLNLDLSRRRAHSVVEYLIRKGIAADRLSSNGYGFTRPIADNATALGRAKNRRVEFTVTDPAAPETATAPAAAPAPTQK